MKIVRFYFQSMFFISCFCLLLIPMSMLSEEDGSSSDEGTSEIEKGISSNDFESFKLILDRNIFDPKRRAPREREREKRPEPPREESFTLLGTMSYADKHLAFFNGTESSWAGAIKLGESLASHKLVSINYNNVLLEYEGETVELTIGSGRSRRGDEAWQTQDEVSSGRYGSRNSSGSNNSSEDSSGPDLSELESNDILKQLMERRKKQMGQ